MKITIVQRLKAKRGQTFYCNREAFVCQNDAYAVVECEQGTGVVQLCKDCIKELSAVKTAKGE